MQLSPKEQMVFDADYVALLTDLRENSQALISKLNFHRFELESIFVKRIFIPQSYCQEAQTKITQARDHKHRDILSVKLTSLRNAIAPKHQSRHCREILQEMSENLDQRIQTICASLPTASRTGAGAGSDQ
jgi:hypothetical protein